MIIFRNPEKESNKQSQVDSFVTSPTPAEPKQKSADTLDGKLSIECDYRKVPNISASETYGLGLNFVPGSHEILAQDTRFTRVNAGENNFWEDRRGFANVCTVIIYADSTVLDVVLSFEMRLFDYIVEGNATRIGPLLYSRIWRSEIPHLEPNARFVFYLRNTGDHDLLVAKVLDFVILQRPGESKPQRVTLHQYRGPIEIGLQSVKWTYNH